MSPKFFVVSGKKLIHLLRKLGYKIIRQKGSHVRIAAKTPKGFHKITIPNHKTMAAGTLNDIISNVAFWNNLSKEELINKLQS